MASNVGLNLTAFLCVADSHTRFWGLALASSLGSLINLVLLLRGLEKLDVHLQWNFLGKEAAKIFLAVFAMGWVTWGALQGAQSLSLPGARLLDFFIPVAAGAGVYFWMAKLLGLSGLEWVLKKGKD